MIETGGEERCGLYVWLWLDTRVHDGQICASPHRLTSGGDANLQSRRGIPRVCESQKKAGRHR